MCGCGDLPPPYNHEGKEKKHSKEYSRLSSAGPDNVGIKRHAQVMVSSHSKDTV
jgi:hypothetical protein